MQLNLTLNNYFNHVLGKYINWPVSSEQVIGLFKNVKTYGKKNQLMVLSESELSL